MKNYKESDYIIESFDEFMSKRFDSNINEDIELAAIGAGAIAHKLYEDNKVISNDTYLLSYMTEYQIEECVDAFYNYEKIHGYQPDFINECIDTFFKISNIVWKNYESYITEGYDEDDTSMIEEDASVIASAAENINDFLTESSKKDKVKGHFSKNKDKYAAGAGIAVGGALLANNLRKKFKRSKEEDPESKRSMYNRLHHGKALQDRDDAQDEINYHNKQSQTKGVIGKVKNNIKHHIDRDWRGIRDTKV